MKNVWTEVPSLFEKYIKNPILKLQALGRESGSMPSERIGIALDKVQHEAELEDAALTKFGQDAFGRKVARKETPMEPVE